jgi:hypothetical protein
LLKISNVDPFVEFYCWGCVNTFVATASCGDSCVETSVSIELPDSWCSLSVAVSFMEDISPVTLFLGLEQTELDSEIGVVLSKSKSICMSYFQITLRVITVTGRVCTSRHVLAGRRHNNNVFSLRGSSVRERHAT